MDSNAAAPAPEETVTTETLGKSLFDLRKQFNALVEPHRSDLWRYCLHLTGSAWDAEDLLQETMLKAFGRLSTIFQPMEIKPYLFRIASNNWINSMRRAKPEPDELSDEHPDEQPDPDPLVIHSAMTRMVALLPPRQRVACLLIDVFDFSLAETARLLNLSVGGTKSLLYRARTTLYTSAEAENIPNSQTIELIEPPDELVKQYVDAFNRRDLNALVALLHPEATSDIVGVFVEEGREMMRSSSLKAWAGDTRPQWVKYGLFAGRPTFFVFVKDDAGQEGLGWLITLKMIDGQITGITDYYFSSDFVRFVAQQMGVNALPNAPFI